MKNLSFIIIGMNFWLFSCSRQSGNTSEVNLAFKQSDSLVPKETVKFTYERFYGLNKNADLLFANEGEIYYTLKESNKIQSYNYKKGQNTTLDGVKINLHAKFSGTTLFSFFDPAEILYLNNDNETIFSLNGYMAIDYDSLNILVMKEEMVNPNSQIFVGALPGGRLLELPIQGVNGLFLQNEQIFFVAFENDSMKFFIHSIDVENTREIINKFNLFNFTLLGYADTKKEIILFEKDTLFFYNIITKKWRYKLSVKDAVYDEKYNTLFIISNKGEVLKTEW